MRSLFCGTGLFSWEPMSFMACRGDVYLDESAHTAMCLQNDASADILGEFSIAETGDIDGEPGDQTGWESSIHGYYEAWDGILHYNGGADGGEASPAAPAGSGAGGGNLPMPRYRAAVMVDGKKTWLDWMEGLYCTDGCGDTFAGVEGMGIVDFEIEPGSLGPDGWYEKNMRNGALIGLTVYYDTTDPGATGYYAAYYRVRWMGGEPDWGKCVRQTTMMMARGTIATRLTWWS